MRLIILFLLFTSIALGQKKDITVFKTNGKELKAKRINNLPKYYKVVLLNGDVVNVPYSQIDRVERFEKRKKEMVSVTEEFVRVSKRNGYMMELIVSGKCKMYENPSMSGGNSYYVLREGEKIATLLGANTTFSLGGYKKEALAYFNDCPKAIEKINKKFKRKETKELVEFYNANCQ